MNRLEQPHQPSERVESEHLRFNEKLYHAAGDQGSKHKEIAAKTAEQVSAGKLPNLQIDGIEHVNPHGKKAPDKTESGSAHANPMEQLTPRSKKAEDQADGLTNAGSSPAKGDHMHHKGISDSGVGNTKVGDGIGNTKVGDGTGNTKIGDGTVSQNSPGATASGTPKSGQ